MKAVRYVLEIVIVGALAAGGAYLYGRSHDPVVAPEEDAEPAPVASVQVAPLAMEAVEETLTALGTVEAAPGETQTYSVPFESRVGHVLVVGGQPVEAGQDLIEVEPSPDTTLQMDQARQELDAARNQLDVVQQKEALTLATRQDVLQTQQAYQAADLRVKSLEKRGIDGVRKLQAAAPGIVCSIDVQAGQIVPAGGALIETIGEGQISVRLGVESVDAARLAPGMAVSIRPVNDPQAAFSGKVHRLARQVNPQTRLVSVYVAPEPGAHLMLNQYVSGVISVATRKALVAPPAAVLPDGEADVLYTVQNGHAVRHEVKVGLQNDRQVELVGSDLKAGEMVVVVGNSELEDGMSVEVQKAQ